MKAEHRRPLIAAVLVTLACLGLMAHAIRTEALGGPARLDPARVLTAPALVAKPADPPAEAPLPVAPAGSPAGDGPVAPAAPPNSPSFSAAGPAGSAAPGREDHAHQGADPVGEETGGVVDTTPQPAPSPTTAPPVDDVTAHHGSRGGGRPGAVGQPPAAASPPVVGGPLDEAVEHLGGRHDHGHHRAHGHTDAGHAWGHVGGAHESHGHDRHGRGH